MDPQPQEPLFDPTSPSTAAAWQAYSKAMIEWQQRQIAKSSQTQSSVQTPVQAPANSGFFGMFGGRSRRSRKSRKSKRSKSRRR